MSPLGKGKPGSELSALGSQPLTQRERRVERERVAKWGPMRAIEKIVKADQTRECARVLFECGLRSERRGSADHASALLCVSSWTS